MKEWGGAVNAGRQKVPAVLATAAEGSGRGEEGLGKGYGERGRRGVGAADRLVSLRGERREGASRREKSRGLCSTGLAARPGESRSRRGARDAALTCPRRRRVPAAAHSASRAGPGR